MNWRARSVKRGRDEAFEAAENEFQAEQDALYAELRAALRQAEQRPSPWYMRWMR